jgi:ribosomal protein L3 glutamine methyltransferase
VDRPLTVRELVRLGADRLSGAGLVFGHGTDNALDESASLVLSALGLGANPMPEQLDSPVAADALRRVDRLLELRISTRKPAAYLTREAWFAGMPFYVDERVLVPRSPIAELIEQRFIPWVVPEQVHSVLDLGTGSGCIACACARAFPHARIDATDVSAGALAVAGENLRRHGLERRIALHHSALFDAIPDNVYDMIVSNPPYVPLGEVTQLPAEYRYEPSLGLAAGGDGLDVVVQILAHAREHLAERGILVVEVGFSQPALEAQFPDIPFLWLEFERGGEGVFLLEREQLESHAHRFATAVEQRAAQTGSYPK